MRKLIGVIAMRIAARDRENALTKEFVHRMIDLAGLPRVMNRIRQPLCQTQAAIDRFEQHGPAIRGLRRRRELDNDGFVAKIVEQDTLLRRVSHAGLAKMAGNRR
jgi:hypothetical protein